MSIVITGASGQLAGGVIEDALQRVDPADLILVTRHPDALAGYAERGAQVRRGDFSDPARLADAFAGGEQMLLISAEVIGARVKQHHDAIDAAVAAGVRRIAYTSIVNPTDANPAAVAPDHKATEEKLRASGVEWTFLRNSVYADLEADNLAAAQATGQLVTNAADGRVAYVARADAAAAAAAVITGSGHAGKAYDITGPELLDADDRAAVFSAITGTPVEVIHVDDEAFAAGIAEATGLPIEVGRLYASFGQAAREGRLDTVSDDLERLTGRAGTSLRAVLEAQPVTL
jgi:NAD(P)H dehydrogenase (quinone)